MNGLKTLPAAVDVNSFATAIDFNGSAYAHYKVWCNLGHPNHLISVMDGFDPLGVFRVTYDGRHDPQHVLVSGKDQTFCLVVPFELEVAKVHFADRNWSIEKLSDRQRRPYVINSQMLEARFSISGLNVEYDNRTEKLGIHYFYVDFAFRRIT